MTSQTDEKENAKPAFNFPRLVDNPRGWGPVGEDNSFGDVPYAPFNKGDRLGKITNWTDSWFKPGRYNQQFASSSGAFQYRAEEDENAFTLVDNLPKPKKQGFYRKPWKPRGWTQFPRNQGGRGGGGGGRGGFQNRWGNQRGGRRGGQGFFGRGGRGGRFGQMPWQQVEVKEPSIERDDKWKEVMEAIDFNKLAKLEYSGVRAPKDLIRAGTVRKYDPIIDNASTKAPITLPRYEKTQFYNITTSADPIIQDLASKDTAQVYTTSVILAAIMASPRSVLSWDIIIRKQNGVIFLDKREESRIDYLTVNENWNEVHTTDKDSPNHPFNLSVEASMLNQNFSQRVLSKGEKDVVSYEEPHPFAEDLEEDHVPAPVGYIYKKIQLDESTAIVVRCEVDAVQKKGDEPYQPLTVKALNEYDHKISGDWRRTLLNQTGGVLAAEMKNNSNKLARWTAQAILTGSQRIVLGFVTRTVAKESFQHEILKVLNFKPQHLAEQMRLSEINMWGIVKYILDKVKKLEDGVYILVKDANKPELHVYDIAGSNLASQLAEEAGTDAQ